MTSHTSGADAFDAFEAAGWEDAVDAYERFFGPITDELIAPILDATRVAEGTRVLDIGCGPGTLVARAANLRRSRSQGIDVSRAMVDRARSRHPDLTFGVGDAHRLPFAAGAFDVVTSNFSILHLGEPERAVAEFARVAAPGGRVAVTTWDHADRARLFGWVTEALHRASAQVPVDIPEGPPFFRFADERELIALLEGGGFGDAEVRTVAFTSPAASIDAIWTGLVDGTVRTAALIQRQSPTVREAIRRAFHDVVSDGGSGSPIEIPVSVKLAIARR